MSLSGSLNESQIQENIQETTRTAKSKRKNKNVLKKPKQKYKYEALVGE